MTVTATYDPEQWQHVPRSSTLQMDRELVWGGDSGEEKWTAALATAPQHESQWQPIETAPRYGRILVWSPDIGQCVASAGWDTETPDDIRWGIVNDIYVEPTLWMPLPQHPNTIKVPRPEGHDSLSIEIKTSYGGGSGGGSCPDTGETADQALFGASAISSPTYKAAQAAENERASTMLDNVVAANPMIQAALDKSEDATGLCTVREVVAMMRESNHNPMELSFVADDEATINVELKILRVCRHEDIKNIEDDDQGNHQQCKICAVVRGEKSRNDPMGQKWHRRT